MDSIVLCEEAEGGGEDGDIIEGPEGLEHGEPGDGLQVIDAPRHVVVHLLC